jgi:hypothetical protein
MVRVNTRSINFRQTSTSPSKEFDRLLPAATPVYWVNDRLIFILALVGRLGQVANNWLLPLTCICCLCALSYGNFQTHRPKFGLSRRTVNKTKVFETVITSQNLQWVDTFIIPAQSDESKPTPPSLFKIHFGSSVTTVTRLLAGQPRHRGSILSRWTKPTPPSLSKIHFGSSVTTVTRLLAGQPRHRCSILSRWTQPTPPSLSKNPFW